MRYFIYSRMTSDTAYTWYGSYENGQPPAILKTIVIKGKADVAPMKGEIIVPEGVRTEVTKDEYEMLLKFDLFILHQKNGHVIATTSKADANKVGQDLKRDVRSAPSLPGNWMNKRDANGKKLPQPRQIRV